MNMLKIEFERESGEGWKPWIYYNPEQSDEAKRTLARLANLYRFTNWRFRLAATDEKDLPALKKIEQLRKEKPA